VLLHDLVIWHSRWPRACHPSTDSTVGSAAPAVLDRSRRKLGYPLDGSVEKLRITALRQVQQLVPAEHHVGVIEKDAQQPVFGAGARAYAFTFG
jgi:hypothetical protein